MRVISLREEPVYTQAAIDFFQSKWATDNNKMIYEDCIVHGLTTESPFPRWYLLLEGETIIGGAGLITNDFVSRMDLWPWICAVYIEEPYRGHAYASRLLERAREDARKAGYAYVYICTDHIGFYERYGYEHIGTGYHPWGESSRIYRASTEEAENVNGAGI